MKLASGAAIEWCIKEPIRPTENPEIRKLCKKIRLHQKLTGRSGKNSLIDF